MTSTMNIAVVSLVLASLVVCHAQTHPNDVPKPPTAELSKFDPFLGKYEVSGNFAGLPWAGTLELKRVIKGWYIEQIILIKSPGIDREFWLLTTWDGKRQKYPLWGFQTLPLPAIDGEVRFEGDEMITQWTSVRPDGSQAVSSNRYRLDSKDELNIVSYRQQVGNTAPEKIGFLQGRRIGQDSTADPGIATGAEQELRNAMAERHRAMLAGDTDIVERLTADEYVQTDISGYLQDKSAWLNEYFRPLAALIKAGKFRWDTYEEKDVQTRTLGDTVIVIGSMILKGTGAKPNGHTWVESPETTFAGTLRFTRVWVKRDGSWKLAALQNALIPTSAEK